MTDAERLWQRVGVLVVAMLLPGAALAGAALTLAGPAGATLPGGNGKIAYANGGIWVAGPGGENPTRLTSSVMDGDPSWSPDGTKNAFTRLNGCQEPECVFGDVWVMDADGADGDEAVRLAGELGPDVILMDLNMPNKNGIEATREILAANPDTGILVVTMLEDDDSVFAAMRAGALGYLLKGARQEEVLRAIGAVANGEAIFGPGIARRVMGLFSAQKPRPPQAFPELTEREEEILALIAGGHNNAEIATRLFLSLKTVQNHVSNIFRKLRVADRVQAALRAREAGLGG